MFTLTFQLKQFWPKPICPTSEVRVF